MLGAQILLGFQFQAPFQNAFETLTAYEKAASLAALCLMILVIGLLIAPSARHRIVEDGEATPGINRFITRIAFATLLPFATALALALSIAGYRIAGAGGALVLAAGGFSIAVGLWYGPYLVRERSGGSAMKEAGEEASITEKIHYVLTEARVILPGAQALLGFQLVIVLTSAFADMPPLLKSVHGVAIACVTLATALLVTPAAYHRIVYDGASDPRFHRLASRILLAATVFLALGLAADIRVVADRITGSARVATVLAAVSFVVLLALWHLWPWVVQLARRNVIKTSGLVL
jgi:hypothetical protein